MARGFARSQAQDCVTIDGARIRARRFEVGLSQKELGIRFGCNQTQISALESGARVRVKAETLERLASALETTETALAKPGQVT
jgi:transcriptional regulator with XRE-family HTH domain